MTIFIEVAKTVIRETIESIIVESQAANKSLLGGFLRNVSLSEAKCLRLKGIVDSIPTIKDALNDEATLMDLQTLVLGCIDAVKAESTALSYKEGATELNLRCLSAALTPIYLKLESLSLLNAPYDQDPLNQFNYFMALYYAKKRVRDNAPSFKPGHFLESGRSFTEEQDRLVQIELEECTRDMRTLDEIALACPAKIAATNETESSFNAIRAKQVFYHVHTLRAAYIALRTKYFTA